VNGSPDEPRFNEPQLSATGQVADSDWNRSEIEPTPELPASRERLFPRKVLIGWALFALAMYFGVRIITTVVKESVKEAVTTAAEKSAKKEIIYRTPNGRITISRNKPNGSITITTDQPEVQAPPARAPAATRATTKAPPPQAAAPPAPEAGAVKR